MEQQTAVEWLQEQYENRPESDLLEDDFKKAKQMEKEQQMEIYRLKAIIEFYEQGCGKEGCKATEPHVH